MISFQKFAEEKTAALIVMILVAVSVGLLITAVPQFGMKSATTPLPGMKPLDALQQTGRDIYVREGCYNCHSQQIRPFRAETERYGHYSVGGESVWDHPFQWGSKRTGPDLARVGGRYNDAWHVMHLNDPRSVVAGSIMPAFPFLAKNTVDPETAKSHMSTMRIVGVPYTDEDIAAADEVMFDVADDGTKTPKTELDALIAYLQTLGTSLKDTTN